MSITIEVELKEVLDQINQKLDKLSDNVKGLSVDMATIKAEIGALKEDVKEIKGTQKAQIWTLIGAIIAAILGILAAFGRLIFFSVNP